MNNPYSRCTSEATRQVDLASVLPWSPEIGEHCVPRVGVERHRGMGLAAIFGLPKLTSISFGELALRVERAFEATRLGYPTEQIPTHLGWPQQFKYLSQWVRLGEAGIYALLPDQVHERFIRIVPHASCSWTLREGHHRCLALWILGVRRVWAVQGEFDHLTHFVGLHRRRVHRKVIRTMKDQGVTWADPVGFLERVKPTSCFNCDEVSKDVERDLRDADVRVERQRGGYSFRGETIVSMEPDDLGEWHEWLVVPGRCLVLDFTIGYHLFARGKITPEQIRKSFAPLCVGEPRSDIQYLTKLVYDPVGNQRRLERPRLLW